MTKIEFDNMLVNDVHSLADMIRNNKLTFDFLISVIDNYSDLPKIIYGELLNHKDCTPEFFMNSYIQFRISAGDTVLNTMILPKAKVLENIDVIAFILGATTPDIDTIAEKYEMNKIKFKFLASNPHVPTDFKMMVFAKTGDTKILPNTAQELFIF